MTHVPHQLAEEFPELSSRISTMKQTDAHFARLVEAYEEVNGEVHRAETNIEPISDLHALEIRKKRMELKDQIYRMLT